ncbi:MAG: PCMD domain-containing protein [Bacteroidaceae bacterium]|nr:PCMD domain-containing protein [Bacteroidaceae bacterium]
MTNKKIFGAMLLTILSVLTSCIREEAPNAECDIIAVKGTWLESNKEILSGSPIISNNDIMFYVKEETSIETLKQLDPEFELTYGALIVKENRIEENGSRGIYLYYRTTSEDGAWSKTYRVSFTKQTVIDVNAVFGFENFELNQPAPKGKYNVWHEVDANGTRLNWWASGNAGFSFTGKGKTPADFPTSSDSAGFKGCCIKLTTRDTGSFGKMAGMPIAAGNIFLGEFISANAMREPLAATRFGLAIAPSKPLTLTGHYRYTPGEIFTDKAKEEVAGRRDTCAIYSVLYEIDPGNIVTLDGSNVLSSDRIVLVAELKNPGEPDEWTSFEIPYVPANGKVFDWQKLEKGEYAITVVASSSKGGAFFEGAVGSTLYVDELKINWDNK